MKKALIIIGVLLVIAVAGGFYFYKQVVPKMAATAIVKGEYSPIIPKKIQKKMNVVRGKINIRLEQAIIKTAASGVTLEQLYSAIDEVKKKDVQRTYQLIKESNTTDPERIFNIAYKNIDIKSFDPILLKPAYDEIIKKEHIQMAINVIDNNNLMENLDMQMARSVAKQILYQKQEEIENRTDVVEF